MSGQSVGRIRIVILIGQTGLGGYERQLYYFVKHNNKALFDYHVIVLNQSKHFTYDEAMRQTGIKVWQLPSSCVGIPRRTVYLCRLLRQIKPVIIHSWSFYANPYVGVAGFLARIPVRLGSLRNEPRYRGSGRLPFLYRWLAYRSVSGLVVNSRLAAEQLGKMKYPAGRIHLVYNGVEVSDLSTSSDPSDIDLSAYGITPEHRIVATVGNLQRRKNHRMFIDSMARILSQFPDVRCLIVGQPVPQEEHMHEELQAYISQLGLSEKVHLTGVRNDVPQLMRRLSVFCLTSRSEGLPNVVLEAMAAACPVVATRVGDVPEVIQDGVNGFLVDSEDVDGLTRGVVELLSNPKLAAHIGAAGRASVERHFGCSSMANNMEKVYRQALAARCPEIVGRWRGGGSWPEQLPGS